MLTYYSLRLSLLISPFLSRRAAYRICTALGHIFFVFNASARRSIESNMRHLLGAQASELCVRRATRRVFVNLTKDYYDLLLLAPYSADHGFPLVYPEGLERIHAARRVGKGVIIVFFHTSGFNLAGQVAVMEGWRPWVVAEPLRPERMRRLVNRLRSSLGVRLISADRGGVRKILRALRANEVVVLAGDRDLTGTGVPVEFFGAQAILPAGAATLALRTGAVILPVLNYRLPGDKVYVRVLDPIERRDTGHFDMDVQAITQRIARVYENRLESHPEEWMVVQPVWRLGRPTDWKLTKPAVETVERYEASRAR